MNLRLDHLTDLHQHLMQVLDSETHAKHVLHQKDRDVFVVQMPDDEADDEERKIDDSVVHNFVNELKPDPRTSHAKHVSPTRHSIIVSNKTSKQQIFLFIN